MQISKSGIELIKRFEGLRLKAYQDSVGVWTIGYGWTQPVNGKKVGPGMQIDQATADRLLKCGVVQYEQGVNQLVKVRITQGQFDALVSFAYIDQVRESDAALMTRLARTYNAVSKPAGGYWLFLEQGEATTASGRTLANVTITREALTSWIYSDGQRGATTEKPAKTADGKGKKGKVSVAYYDAADCRTKTQSLEHNGPDQANSFTQPSKALADSSAKAKMTKANRNERRMTLSGPGRPQYVPLTSEARITTAGFGEEEDRTWLIESLAFSLNSSGLAMAFNLVTDIKPPAGGKAAKKEKKSDGIGYFDEKSESKG